MSFHWPLRRERAWLAPEVVQTSSMDCGPAALKCLLEGHGVPVSYGRLREACQTSVDGTSIDTIEDVAQQLGLHAEQSLIPRDFVCLDEAQSFPAVVVVHHADNFTHFVVVWARHGEWLQVMDPAVGRRWISRKRFEQEIFAHEQSVNARDWRSWCNSADYQRLLHQRLDELRISEGLAYDLAAEAASDKGWFAFGALDASIRLCTSLASAGGLRRGKETARVLSALFRDTVSSGHDIFSVIPPDYWSVIPDITNEDASREMLLVRGGVVLKTGPSERKATAPLPAELSPELAAALVEEAPRPFHRLWSMLQEDDAFRPGLVGMTIAIQALALAAEAVLFRGLLEVTQELALPIQRMAALAVLVLLALLVGLLDIGLAALCIGQGRRLEARVRQAIFAKLPRLKDRYFQSRPITDMADRNHAIHAIRSVPMLGAHGLQSLCELCLTFVALVAIAPTSVGWAAACVIAAMAIPTLAQPLLNERDLRVRNHGGALHGFYLDALLGLAPIRAHRAELAVSRQHEGLLVAWTEAARGLTQWSLAANGIQSLVCTGLVAGLLLSHFAAAQAVTGADLLIVFWALKLPAAADRLAGIARAYPAVRNTLLRQMEPLDAPEEERGEHRHTSLRRRGGVQIEISDGLVLAGGHTILRDINVVIQPGEHLAIVGRSGAGKSSLLGLLLGWHRLAQGNLRIDGEELGGEMLETLRLATAWVDPQVQLWNRSLLDNLTYAVDDQNLARVRALVEASGLMAVSSRLPHGLQSPLGEGGGLLSGGEGQRVRLGRALLSDCSRLALLDEPFRGLDRHQRRTLLASTRNWWKGTTLLCVSHDIAETMDFDRVLVIDDGRIVEDGKPIELAQTRSQYRDLLHAEESVMRTMWGASTWRRWTVAGGQVTESIPA